MAEDHKLALYLMHRAALVESAAPIVGCRARAEDVVQDAYLKLNETRLDDGIRHPLSYLFRLVRNLAIDRARRLALENRHGAREDVPLDAASDLPNPEQQALAREDLRRLCQALEDLPPRTRQVFEMNRMQGLTAPQIADIMGVAPRTVYALLADAMTHCRARLFLDAKGRGR